VNLLRSWINEPKAMGLPPELENLILLTFAAQTNRAWFRFGSNPHNATIEDLPDNAELREQSLPDEQIWNRAVERASAIFGLAPSPLRSANNAVKLGLDLGQQVGALLESARDLVRELQSRIAALGLAPESSARFKTAQNGLTLLEALRTAPEQERINALASARLDEQGVSVGTALKQAPTVVRAIRDAHWFLIESASKLPPAGEFLLKRARELLQHDELAQPFVVTLKRIIEDAAKLLSEKTVIPLPRASPASQIPAIDSQGGTTGRPIQVGPAPLSAGGDTIFSTDIKLSGIQPSIESVYWAGSDDAEVTSFYAGRPDKIARNRQLVRALKNLYRHSQVEGDSTPRDIPEDRLIEVLEVHHIKPLAQGGADERHNMIVVTPTLHALIHSDPACEIDLKSGKIRLFGRDFIIQVAATHNG
jgi:hypothetical protein